MITCHCPVYDGLLAYDAQRNILEKELKAAKLPWEDKCFNVDSFQGWFRPSFARSQALIHIPPQAMKRTTLSFPWFARRKLAS